MIFADEGKPLSIVWQKSGVLQRTCGDKNG
jgi:hypothetical protein